MFLDNFENMMGSANANGIQMMGLINAMKTGNPTADAFLAMAVPYALGTGMAKAKTFLQTIGAALTRKLEEQAPKEEDDGYRYRRELSYSLTTSSGSSASPAGGSGGSGTKNRNDELYRAIQLYIHKTSAANMDTNAHIEFHQEIASAQHLQQQQGRQKPGSEAYESLKRCEIVEKMPIDAWYDVGMYKGHPVLIRFQSSAETTKSGGDDEDDDGSRPKRLSLSTTVTTYTVKFKSTGPKSIGVFIDTVFAWYTKLHESKTKECRYLFDTDGRVYRLSDEKTFDSLFSAPCRELARIVDHFHNKTGKYAIKGYPQKLGVLLHGPPGTGKTSVIKALANKTGRSIVNLSLSSIQTNRQLKSAIFERRYINPSGQDMQLGFFDVIFVLEDMDADSPIVRSRSLAPVAKKGRKRKAPAPIHDALNLTGLLNVLDGVVDTPGRMIVITTNHPEHLDPALIRPGRIDKILNLSYMEGQDMILMIQHYFECMLTAEEVATVLKFMASPDANFTPAVVEQITIEHDTVSDMIRALETRIEDAKNARRLREALEAAEAKGDFEVEDDEDDDEPGIKMRNGRKRNRVDEE